MGPGIVAGHGKTGHVLVQGSGTQKANKRIGGRGGGVAGLGQSLQILHLQPKETNSLAHGLLLLICQQAPSFAKSFLGLQARLCSLPLHPRIVQSQAASLLLCSLTLSGLIPHLSVDHPS